MKWRVHGSQGEENPTSVLVEAPDAQAAATAAQNQGLTVLGVEIEKSGSPIGPSPEGQAPVLIERTGKRWKAMLAISVLLLAGGMIGVGFLVARQPRAIGDWPAGLIAMLAVAALGFVGLVWARLGAWWHHG